MRSAGLPDPVFAVKYIAELLPESHPDSIKLLHFAPDLRAYKGTNCQSCSVAVALPETDLFSQKRLSEVLVQARQRSTSKLRILRSTSFGRKQCVRTDRNTNHNSRRAVCQAIIRPMTFFARTNTRSVRPQSAGANVPAKMERSGWHEPRLGRLVPHSTRRHREANRSNYNHQDAHHKLRVGRILRVGSKRDLARILPTLHQ